MDKIGFGFLVLLGQGRPKLQPMLQIRLVFQVVRRAFRMHNAASGRHPVDSAGGDTLHRTQTVAVHHRAIKQVSHRGQADVRVRSNVMVGARFYRQRAEMIEKHKRPHRLPSSRRQQAAHHEAGAQVFVVPAQFEFNAHASRPSVVVISVVTVLISLCTGHFCATACSSCSCASLKLPCTLSVALRR